MGPALPANGSYKIKNPGGQDFVQLHLCDDDSYRDVILCKGDPVELLNIAIYSDHKYENARWYLDTSLDSPQQAVTGEAEKLIDEGYKAAMEALK